MNRRSFLYKVLGAGLVALACTAQACRGGPKSDVLGGQGRPRVIRMGGKRGELIFDPDRLQVRPGETVRWVVESAGHSTTAYHPTNHELYRSRIPEGAEPWNSGILPNKGDSFKHTFTVEGVYNYYCIPHEGAGMVGAIVVGRALDGPGTAPVQPEISVAARSKLEELIAWAKGTQS